MKLMKESSGKETAVNVIILIIKALLPLVGIILLRYFIDMITGAAVPVAETVSGTLLWLIAAMALALLADDLLSFAGSYITRKQSYLLEGHISSMIHSHASGLGLKYFEDPLFHDRLERAARDISWRPAAIVSDIVLMGRGLSPLQRWLTCYGILVFCLC